MHSMYDFITALLLNALRAMYSGTSQQNKMYERGIFSVSLCQYLGADLRRACLQLGPGFL